MNGREAIYGWAMKDPLAAGNWYRENPDINPRFRAELLSRVVGGIALTHPEKLTDFLATLSEQEQIRTVGHSVWNLLHGGGITEVNRWLDEIQGGDWPESLKSTKPFLPTPRVWKIG